MKTKILIAGAVVLVIAGAIGGTVVLAQSSLPGHTATVQASTDQQTATDQCTQFRNDLAQRLNVSPDKLQQAFKDTAKDMIDQALKNGKLTQQQADNLKQKIDSAQGKCFPFGAGILAGRAKVAAQGAMLKVGFDAAATALHMSSAQLKSALQSGKSIADIAKDQNVDLQTVKTAVINAEKSAIDQALQNGRLTQQQADNAKAMLDKNADNVLDRLFNIRAHKRP